MRLKAIELWEFWVLCFLAVASHHPKFIKEFKRICGKKASATTRAIGFEMMKERQNNTSEGKIAKELISRAQHYYALYHPRSPKKRKQRSTKAQ